MAKQLKALMIGAGARGGKAYAPYAEQFPEQLQFIGVAEPDAVRLGNFISSHPASAQNAVESWESLLQRDKFADIVFVCTQDQMHFEPAKLAIQQGYDLFIEKPISVSPQQCQILADLAREYKISTAVGHVLRYTTFFKKIKEIIQSGAIGTVISVQHNENVGHIHMSHSFVRGAWSNSESSNPMILAKSCHDMDIICWLLNEPCQKLSSYGSLQYFCPKNAPKGAPANCLDGCPVEKSCPYYAPKIYTQPGSGWGRSIHIGDLDREQQRDFLRNSSYGSCVFRAGNNVVDHQVVNMEFASGTTVAFTMSAFTAVTSRTLKIMGSQGVIHASMEHNNIRVETFRDNLSCEFQLPSDCGLGGHGDGDLNLVRDFVAHCQDKALIPEQTPIQDSLPSHFMAFAAEESRNTSKNIDMGTYIAEICDN